MRVLFYGTPAFSVPALQALLEEDAFTVVAVVTQPDRGAGRGRRLTPSPVKVVAAEYGIPILQPTNIRRSLPPFLEEIAAFEPIDVGVVVAFGQILPIELLHLPKYHSINIHASLLPRWRGAAPIHRAIMAGDTETGVALMDMEAGLDTGGVYISTTVPITQQTTTGDLHDKLATAGASLLVQALPQIVDGSLALTPQTSDGVTYAQKISNDECCIDWNVAGEEIDRLIRGLSPFPGAYTWWNGKRLKLYRSTFHPRTHTLPTATLMECSETGIFVAVPTGALEITELQLEGRKRMSASEFLLGYRVALGERLGSDAGA